MQLNIKAFALTCGFLWGVSLFFLTWWLILLESSPGDSTWIGRFYVGYNISPSGSIIGFLWGCADGAIGGLAFGWLYNFIILKMAIEKHKHEYTSSNQFRYTIIEVQKELIERLKKDVGRLEAVLKKTKNPTKPNKQKVGFMKKHKPKK